MFTNNEIMRYQMRHIVKDNLCNLYNNDNGNITLSKSYNNDLNNNLVFDFLNSRTIDNTYTEIINKILSTEYTNLYTWLKSDVELNNKLVPLSFYVTDRDCDAITPIILEDINKLIKIRGNYDCVISFSSGLLPAKIMMENKLVDNCIIINGVGPNIGNNFINVKNCNILHIIGENDNCKDHSEKAYEQLKDNNNCEVIRTKDNHKIPTDEDTINKIIDYIKNYPYLFYEI
jgi:hypothetical protein